MVLDISQDLLFWKIWFCLSLPPILVSFELIQVSIIGTIMLFVRKLMFLKCSCQKPVKRNCGRPVFLKSCRLQQIFQRFSCILTKFLILQDKFYRHIQKYAFFVCCKRKSSRSSQQRLISKCLGNLVIKLMKMWWNLYYSKFESEIWGSLGY